MVYTGKYGVINKTHPKIMGYWIVNYFSGAFTLQEYITIDGQVIKADELSVRPEYFSIMK